MALKKISRKKMGEVIDEVIEDIRKGDFSRIFPTFNKYKMDIHTVEPNGSTFLWNIAYSLSSFEVTPVLYQEQDRNTIACMQFLIDHGADVNHQYSSGETILFAVAGACPYNPDAVEMLIRNGADVNHRDNDGYVPLVGAIMGFKKGKPDTFTPLLKAGADPYIKLGKKSPWSTPVEMVEQYERKDQAELKAAFFKALEDLGIQKK